MKITNVNVYGIENAVLVSRYPMIADVEKWHDEMTREEHKKAYNTAYKLATTPVGAAHDQFLTGITVTFDVTGTIQWWQEAERYRFLYFISSTSKMHRLHKMNIDECCNKYVDPKIKEIVECKQQEYLHALELQKEGILPKKEVKEYFYRLVYNVPQGFTYTAGMTTNYRQLKTIYQQRKNHRLQEWKDFCRWIEELPCSEFIIGGKANE